MREFVDEQGRTWGLRVDVTSIRRVRELVGIDLYKCMDSQQALSNLVDDVVALVDAIHALCKEQCEHRGIDPESFAVALFGDAISRASDALVQSTIDFFPQSRGKILRQIWENIKEINRLRIEKAQVHADELTRQVLLQSTQGTQESAQKAERSENLPLSRKQRGKKTQGSKRRFGTD